MNEGTETQVRELATSYASTLRRARANIAAEEERRRRQGRTIAQAPPSMEARLKPNEAYDSTLRGMAMAELRRERVAIVRVGAEFKVDPEAIALFVETLARETPGLVIVPDPSVAQVTAQRQRFRARVSTTSATSRRNIDRVNAFYERVEANEAARARRLQIEAEIEQYALQRQEIVAVDRRNEVVTVDVTQLDFLETMGVFEQTRTAPGPQLDTDLALRSDTPRLARASTVADQTQIAMGF